MDISGAVKSCILGKYATFSGRASRSEYWYFLLFLFLLAIVTSIFDAAIFPGNELKPIYSIFSLLTIIPSISAAARRLHDVDRSGWWQLLYFTIVGSLVVLYWLIKKSDAGDNKHGSNPL